MNRIFSDLKKTGVALALAQAALLCGAPPAAAADEPLTVNWYHGKEFLYPIAHAFEVKTGIDVEVTDSYDRFDTDVILAADYLTLSTAASEGRFADIRSESRDARVPAQWRDDDGQWYGVAVRLRAAVYNPEKVKQGRIQSVYDLADPEFRNRMCLRSSENEYNRSLVATLIVEDGKEKAAKWVDGVRANAGEAPEYKGDIANIMRVANGECDVTFVNTYYLGYMLSGKRAERYPFTAEDMNRFYAGAQKVAIAWLDQETRGNPANVTGAAVSSKSKRKADALKFVDFLLSDEGQALLTNNVFKYPTVPGVAWSLHLKNQGRVRMSDFDLNAIDGDDYETANELFKKAGWE